MPIPYTPSATKPTFPLDGPADGEVWNYATIQEALIQKALDYAAWLDANGGAAATAAAATAAAATAAVATGLAALLGRFNAYFGDGTTQQTRVAMRGAAQLNVGSGWTWANGNGASYVTTSVVVDDEIYIELDPLTLPHGRTIVSVTAHVSYSGSTHGVNFPPANMPELYLKRVDLSFAQGTLAQIGDTSVIGVYEAPHTLTMTGGGVVDRTQHAYFVAYAAESGTHALAGCAISGITVVWS